MYKLTYVNTLHTLQNTQTHQTCMNATSPGEPPWRPCSPAPLRPQLAWHSCHSFVAACTSHSDDSSHAHAAKAFPELLTA